MESMGCLGASIALYSGLCSRRVHNPPACGLLFSPASVDGLGENLVKGCPVGVCSRALVRWFTGLTCCENSLERTCGAGVGDVGVQVHLCSCAPCVIPFD